jgi:hypothetical protein
MGPHCGIQIRLFSQFFLEQDKREVEENMPFQQVSEAVYFPQQPKSSHKETRKK